jgi:signal transduction histidine kinase/ActR/RegA family two-component response regulator
MSLISVSGPIRQRPWLAYSLAIVLALIALIIRLMLGTALTGYPFLTFVGAVMITAFLGGAGSGVMTATLSFFLAEYFLIVPLGGRGAHWPMMLVVALVYGVLTGTIIAIIHGMQKASAAERRSEAALRTLNVELEERIAIRTEELRAEMAGRAEALGRIRQMQKMDSLGQLTGGISHDFNNMLSVIIGSLDMARRRLATGDIARAEDAIDNASEGAQRAALLTAQLLAFSRRQPLAPQPIDANRLVSGMSEMLRRTIGEHIRIETTLPDGLWHAFADPGQLESAIVNLAVNARDAMPDGGTLTIQTANAELDDEATPANPDAAHYVMIAVGDTGCGMAPDVAAKAFDPFYTTKSVGKGTGLGLSQVYGYVKQSGGHVKIVSDVDRGTIVRIYLPRHRGEMPLAAPAPDPVELAPVDPDRVVLVVEDEPQVRHVTVEALRTLGYSVIEVDNGAHAIALLETEPAIGLLFTDMVMPGMNGRQLADIVRARWPGMPILFTTGYMRDAMPHDGIVDPGISFLPKPFTLDQLARTVGSAVTGDRLPR